MRHDRLNEQSVMAPFHHALALASDHDISGRPIGLSQAYRGISEPLDALPPCFSFGLHH